MNLNYDVNQDPKIYFTSKIWLQKIHKILINWKLNFQEKLEIKLLIISRIIHLLYLHVAASYNIVVHGKTLILTWCIAYKIWIVFVHKSKRAVINGHPYNTHVVCVQDPAENQKHASICSTSIQHNIPAFIW